MARLNLFIAAACVVSLVPCDSAVAQQEQTRAIDGGTREMIISIFVPELVNAPFSATVRTEWVKRLGDGSTITVKNRRLVARDAAGRIFQERRVLSPSDDREQSPVTQTEVYDPATGKRTDCTPQLQCREYAYRWAHAAATPAAAGELPDGRGTLTREALGTRSIEGFDVTGTRETTVLNAGVMGNDRPLTIVKEFWYSPVLQMNLLTTRDDPRFGVQTFRVTDISTVTPDPKLFRLPRRANVTAGSD